MVPERGFYFKIGFENAIVVTQISYLAFAPAEAEIVKV